jgi:hypothetical protein
MGDRPQFGTVVRDFIPTTDDATPAELEKLKKLKGMGRGMGQRDFIPGPDHKLMPPSGSAEQGQEAIDRSMAAQASAAREMYQGAVKTLKELNVADAIEHITQAPFAQQELLLVAEARHGKRKSILDRFGEPDPAVAARWAVLVDGAPTDEASPEDAEASSGDAEE